MQTIAETIKSQVTNFEENNDFHQLLLDLSVNWVEFLSSVPTEISNTNSGNTDE